MRSDTKLPETRTRNLVLSNAPLSPVLRCYVRTAQVLPRAEHQFSTRDKLQYSLWPESGGVDGEIPVVERHRGVDHLQRPLGPEIEGSMRVEKVHPRVEAVVLTKTGGGRR